MKYQPNWEEVKIRWSDYWDQKNTGRPLMRVIARKPELEQRYQEAKRNGEKFQELPGDLRSKDMEDKYLNAGRIVDRFRYSCENRLYLAESFPNLSVDFGPGSVAGYLGSEIIFEKDTVWFEKCVEDWNTWPELRFDPENKWWKRHYQLVQDARRLAGDDFYIGIPDLMENMDVLASLRGAQDLIFDMMDEPEQVIERVSQVTEAYFEYYDRFYDVVKNDKDGGSCYTVFQVWGPGRTAKLQCDFSAMMSPLNFHCFVQDSLREQGRRLDNVLYHLDGPDSIRHVDALMEVEEIKALQWTSGDYGPDGTLEDWDVIYDKVRRAGKSLWIRVYSGEFEDWIRNVDRIVGKYGSRGLFIMFPEMSVEQADILMDHAEKQWSDIEGTFRA